MELLCVPITFEMMTDSLDADHWIHHASAAHCSLLRNTDVELLRLIHGDAGAAGARERESKQRRRRRGNRPRPKSSVCGDLAGGMSDLGVDHVSLVQEICGGSALVRGIGGGCG